MKVRLTQHQLALIRTVRKRIDRAVDKAGLTIRYVRRGPAGVYHLHNKTIVLCRETRFRNFLPRILDELFTLAHEFGHHLGEEKHKQAGRVLDCNLSDHLLFDEAGAWREARSLLRRHGLRGEDIWSLFTYRSGSSLSINLDDFAATFSLAEKLRRARVACPSCGARRLRVMGHESERDCTIVCIRCGAHTRPRRSTRLLSAGVRNGRFTGLCPCEDYVVHMKIEGY